MKRRGVLKVTRTKFPHGAKIAMQGETLTGVVVRSGGETAEVHGPKNCNKRFKSHTLLKRTWRKIKVKIYAPSTR